MMQIARNLTDAEDGFVKGKRYVLMDRDGKFSPAFQAIWKTEGVNAVPLPGYHQLAPHHGLMATKSDTWCNRPGRPRRR